jgi:hypothetical protein
MTIRPEFLALLDEHRRLRLSAIALWRNSPGRRYGECMDEVMMEFWKAHPEWAPFNVKIEDAPGRQQD